MEKFNGRYHRVNVYNLQHLSSSKIGDYIIRGCTGQDLSEVILINWQTLPEHYSDSFYQNLLKDAPDSFLVVEYLGKVVGYVMCRIEFGFSTIKKFGMGKKGHIVSIGILDEHRKKGLATEMMQIVMKALKESGCTETYLEVRISNKSAIGLYNRLEFKNTTVYDNYYKDGERAFMMSKTL